MAAARERGRTSTGVKVLAWVELGLGCLWTLQACRSVLSIVWLPARGAPIGTWAYAMGMLGLGSLLAVVLLVSGIGLLRGRRWAWRTSLAFAAMSILDNIVWAVLVLSGLLAPFGVRPLGHAVVGLVLPFVILVVLTRRGVRAQFSRQG
jgi:hypothetical protein